MLTHSINTENMKQIQKKAINTNGCVLDAFDPGFVNIAATSQVPSDKSGWEQRPGCAGDVSRDG